MKPVVHSLTAAPDSRASLRQDLREILLNLDYHAYEQLMRDILRRSGYSNVHLVGRRHKRGRTRSGELDIRGHGIGGHDLKAYTATDLTASLTLTQVKQYRRVVSRRFVDELRGAILRSGAEHGLIITTSTFSKVARQAAGANEVAPITLLNGEAVLDLLIRHRLGVRQSVRGETSAPGEVQEGLVIDTPFFDKLQEKYRSTYEGAAPTAPTSVRSPIDHSRAHQERAHQERAHATQAIQDGSWCLPPQYYCPRSIHHFIYLKNADLLSDNSLSANHAGDPGTSGGDMQWKTHVLIGLSSLWLVELVPPGIGTEHLPLMVAAAAFGSLLPDLDAAESKIKHLSLCGIKPFYLPGQAIYRGFGHRGFLHSSSALVLAGICALPLAYWTGWQSCVALVLGYGSHLAADACTRSGIPWRYVPLLNPNKRRYHLLPPRFRFVTGSEAEGVLLPLAAIIVLILLLRILTFSGLLPPH